MFWPLHVAVIPNVSHLTRHIAGVGDDIANLSICVCKSVYVCMFLSVYKTHPPLSYQFREILSLLMLTKLWSCNAVLVTRLVVVRFSHAWHQLHHSNADFCV